jgi:hypothetical protein
MTRSLLRITTLAATIAALTACTYKGGDIGDPFERKAHWFSFVSGDDIKATCDASQPDRSRVIYNAIYDEQLRIYEWDSVKRRLLVRVVTSGSVSTIRGDDLAAPWRAEEEKVQLDPKTYDRLEAAMADSGAFGPPATGLELPSRSYFWTSATCHQGRYHFTAWRYPSAGFEALAFPGLLQSLDPSGIAVRTAAPVPIDPVWEERNRNGKVMAFSMRVGQDGLVR